MLTRRRAHRFFQAAVEHCWSEIGPPSMLGFSEADKLISALILAYRVGAAPFKVLAKSIE